MANRLERANSELQRCISLIVQTKLNDPRLNCLIYISDVSVSADFKYCKIKFSLDTTDKAEIDTCLNVLKKSSGFIKKELSTMVRMPQMPELRFEYDKGSASSVRINEILKTLNIPKEGKE